MGETTTSQERTRQAARSRREKHERRRRFAQIGVVAALTIVVGIAAAGLLGQGNASDHEIAPWAGSAYTGGPRLAVDQADIDHGDVPYGYEAEAVYRLKNVGDQVLRIENPEVNILDGCWPPLPVIGQMTLQPGEETTLDLSFEMHEGMGGPHEFEIVVPSNDAVDSSTSLLVAATYPEP